MEEPWSSPHDLAHQAAPIPRNPAGRPGNVPAIHEAHGLGGWAPKTGRRSADAGVTDADSRFDAAGALGS